MWRLNRTRGIEQRVVGVRVRTDVVRIVYVRLLDRAAALVVWVAVAPDMAGDVSFSGLQTAASARRHGLRAGGLL